MFERFNYMYYVFHTQGLYSTKPHNEKKRRKAKHCFESLHSLPSNRSALEFLADLRPTTFDGFMLRGSMCCFSGYPTSHHTLINVTCSSINVSELRTP